MARLFKTIDSCEKAFAIHKAQIFICGGHGGLVTYDGKGGAMIKEGGPMDRLFFFKNDGVLMGDAGLDLIYGHINIKTGKLTDDVSLLNKDSRTEDTCACFTFEGLDDGNAFEIKGGISEIGLGRDTVLVSGDISKSEMIWESGDVSGKDQTLPYVAFHPNVKVHPALLDWFGVPSLEAVGAETGWCKLAPSAMEIERIESKGVPFRTQQHLGHLRVLLG